MENDHINIDSVESLQGEEGADKICVSSSEISDSLPTKCEDNNNLETKTQGKEKENKSGKQYPCKLCSKVFDSHQALGGHMNGHSKEERNRNKYEKYRTWVKREFPDEMNKTSRELRMQGSPTNQAACTSSSHPGETDGVLSQLGHQSSQQMQSFQGLQAQQRQGLPIYQVPQWPQNYQAPQGSQSYGAPQDPPRYQAPQLYQTPQGPQSYRAPQGHPIYQAPQGPPMYRAPQGSPSYQAPQGSPSYQAPQGSPSYQAPQGPQSYRAPQGTSSYRAPQGSPSYQAPQRSPSYQALQGSPSSQAPQGSPGYQAPHGSPSPQAPQRSPSSQAPQGPRRQQQLNSNPNMSNGQTAPTIVPSNGQMNNSAHAQGPHPQVSAQREREQMLYLRNTQTGYRPTTWVGAPFMNGNGNNSFSSAPHAQGLGLGNQLTGAPHDETAALCQPGNLPNTDGASNHFEVNDPMDEEPNWDLVLDDEWIAKLTDDRKSP